jgi:hypothetical protein
MAFTLYQTVFSDRLDPKTFFQKVTTLHGIFSNSVGSGVIFFKSVCSVLTRICCQSTMQHHLSVHSYFALGVVCLASTNTVSIGSSLVQY